MATSAIAIISEVKIAAKPMIISAPSDRKKLLTFILISLTVHALAIIIGRLTFVPRMPLQEDNSISVDLAADLSLSAAKDTAIPKAKEAPQEAVPANILPQLPKKFEIEQEKPSDKETFVEEKDQKKNAPKDETAAKEEATKPKEEEEANRLKKDDAMKRLALEKLRLDEKKSNELKAPSKDAIARLKEELGKSDRPGGLAGGAGGAQLNRYHKLLYTSIRRNWSLPETFKIDNGKIRAQIEIKIDKRGELMSLKVVESSGNKAYDEMAIAAVRASTPLPPPSDEIVGQAILLPFTP